MDLGSSLGISGANMNLFQQSQLRIQRLWIAVLAELKAEEQRFGASHWADLDTLFHP